MCVAKPRLLLLPAHAAHPTSAHALFPRRGLPKLYELCKESVLFGSRVRIVPVVRDDPRKNQGDNHQYIHGTNV